MPVRKTTQASPTSAGPSQPNVPAKPEGMSTTDWLKMLAGIGLRTGGQWGGTLLGGASGLVAAIPTGEAAAPVTVPFGAMVGGAAGSALGEYLAEKYIEGVDPNLGRVGVAAGFGGIPGTAMVRAGKPLASAALGSLIGYGSVAGDKFARGEGVEKSFNPTEWSKGELVGPILGGGMGALAGHLTPPKYIGKTPPPPPPPSPPPAAPATRAAAAKATGSTPIIGDRIRWRAPATVHGNVVDPVGAAEPMTAAAQSDIIEQVDKGFNKVIDEGYKVARPAHAAALENAIQDTRMSTGRAKNTGAAPVVQWQFDENQRPISVVTSPERFTGTSVGETKIDPKTGRPFVTTGRPATAPTVADKALATPANKKMLDKQITTRRTAGNQAVRQEAAADLQAIRQTQGGTDIGAIKRGAEKAKTSFDEKAQRISDQAWKQEARNMNEAEAASDEMADAINKNNAANAEREAAKNKIKSAMAQGLEPSDPVVESSAKVKNPGGQTSVRQRWTKKIKEGEEPTPARPISAKPRGKRGVAPVAQAPKNPPPTGVAQRAAYDAWIGRGVSHDRAVELASQGFSPKPLPEGYAPGPKPEPAPKATPPASIDPDLLAKQGPNTPPEPPPASGAPVKTPKPKGPKGPAPAAAVKVRPDPLGGKKPMTEAENAALAKQILATQQAEPGKPGILETELPPSPKESKVVASPPVGPEEPPPSTPAPSKPKAPNGGAPSSAEAAKIDPEVEQTFGELLADARAQGYTGSAKDLKKIFDQHLPEAQGRQGAMNEGIAEGLTPKKFYTAIARHGGLGDDKGFPGEIQHLWQSSSGYRPGKGTTKLGRVKLGSRLATGGFDDVKHVLTGKNGLSLDHMAELLREEGPEFSHIKGPNDLLDQFEEFSRSKYSGASDRYPLSKALKSIGVRPGSKWWEPQGVAEKTMPVEEFAKAVVKEGEKPLVEVPTPTPVKPPKVEFGGKINKNPDKLFGETPLEILAEQEAPLDLPKEASAKATAKTEVTHEAPAPAAKPAAEVKPEASVAPPKESAADRGVPSGKKPAIPFAFRPEKTEKVMTFKGETPEEFSQALADYKAKKQAFADRSPSISKEEKAELLRPYQESGENLKELGQKYNTIEGLKEDLSLLEQLPEDTRKAAIKQIIEDESKKAVSVSTPAGIRALIKNESGSANIMPLLHLGGALAGGAIGAATSPDDRVAGAIMGGTAGGLAPLALRHVNANTVKEIGQRLPNIQRASLLSDAPSLIWNSFAGPIGSGVMGGLEHWAAGNPAGKKLLKEMLRTDSNNWGKQYLKSLARASEKIGQNERADYIRVGTKPNLLDKITALPATYMTAGDMATREAAARAGMPVPLAEQITMTNEPRSALGKSSANFGRNKEDASHVIANMMLPFKRTAVNILESGAERMPGVGSFIELFKSGGQPLGRAALARQGIGAGVFASAYALGRITNPNTDRALKIHKMISNLGGQYALIADMGFAAGMAAQQGKNPVNAAFTNVGYGFPLPVVRSLMDAAKPIKKAFAGEPVDLNPLHDSNDFPKIIRPRIIDNIKGAVKAVTPPKRSPYDFSGQ